MIQSDWEPAFRARVKAIALCNEVIRLSFIDDAPGRDELRDISPRPVLVAEGGGWICSNPGCSDIYEPDPKYRRPHDDELASLQQPTSTVEVWGSADVVG